MTLLPPVGRGKSEQSKKANDYPAFRRPFSTEVCRIWPNFAAKAQEIAKRCANVIVNAQSINKLNDAKRLFSAAERN
jgi:hypothetical protein